MVKDFDPVVRKVTKQQPPKPFIGVVEEELKEISKKTGKQITRGREAKKMTQKEFAQKINVPLAVIVDWEMGKGVYNKNVYEKIERELGIKLSE